LRHPRRFELVQAAREDDQVHQRFGMSFLIKEVDEPEAYSDDRRRHQRACR
jgi:hypothetical protein